VKEIDALMAKSRRFMRTARNAMDDGDLDSCVSRCYYAMFFLAEAILLTKDVTASSHKGVLAQFGKHLIKSGVFDRSLGRALNEAYDMRLVGDYGVGVTIDPEDAEATMVQASEFVEITITWLDEWMKKDL